MSVPPVTADSFDREPGKMGDAKAAERGRKLLQRSPLFAGIDERSQREIAAARQIFAISFGSCSFTEPIDDLRSLHLL